MESAILREKQIKGGSRATKLALVGNTQSELA
jgi:predicted GIY-YIG superfamily endonuclease